MKLDTKKLRKLAASATQPGLWSVSEEHPNLILDANGFWLAAVGRDPKDAAFIAACSPDVVLALLDELEQCRADVETIKAHYARLVAKARQFERYPGGEGCRQELRVALEALGQLDADRIAELRAKAVTK